MGPINCQDTNLPALCLVVVNLHVENGRRVGVAGNDYDVGQLNRREVRGESVEARRTIVRPRVVAQAVLVDARLLKELELIIIVMCR